jgi:hypothetical protein
MKHPSPVQIFQEFLPPTSIPYCYDLWKRYPFELKLRNPRQTKVGDFCARRGQKPIITLNRDLHPFLFLVTYIHEFSHHAVHIVYGNLPESHGKEWKLAFKTFMQPLMDMPLFPEDLHHALKVHLKDPKASSFSDSQLTQIFRRYDSNNQSIILFQIEIGKTFALRGRVFRKGKLLRKRFLCTEIKSGKDYLVPADAEISLPD